MLGPAKVLGGSDLGREPQQHAPGAGILTPMQIKLLLTPLVTKASVIKLAHEQTAH